MFDKIELTWQGKLKEINDKSEFNFSLKPNKKNETVIIQINDYSPITISYDDFHELVSIFSKLDKEKGMSKLQYARLALDTHTFSKSYREQFSTYEIFCMITDFLKTNNISEFMKSPYFNSVCTEKLQELKKEKPNTTCPICEDCGKPFRFGNGYLSYSSLALMGAEFENLDKLHFYCKDCSKNHSMNWNPSEDEIKAIHFPEVLKKEVL